MATSEVPAGAASPADRARKAMIGGEAEKVQESGQGGGPSAHRAA